jgi:hypothetical protein
VSSVFSKVEFLVRVGNTLATSNFKFEIQDRLILFDDYDPDGIQAGLCNVADDCSRIYLNISALPRTSKGCQRY